MRVPDSAEVSAQVIANLSAHISADLSADLSAEAVWMDFCGVNRAERGRIHMFRSAQAEEA